MIEIFVHLIIMFNILRHLIYIKIKELNKITRYYSIFIKI